MAKKKSKPPSSASTNGGAKPQHGAKSAAVRDYLLANKDAKPKEIVEALKAQGIDISPNMVSIIKAKAGIKKAKRSAQAAVASNDKTAGAQTSKSNGLEAALMLYKAARGQDVQPKQVTTAFLSLVEMLS
jgi:hypothetical protein